MVSQLYHSWCCEKTGKLEETDSFVKQLPFFIYIDSTQDKSVNGKKEPG